MSVSYNSVSHSPSNSRAGSRNIWKATDPSSSPSPPAVSSAASSSYMWCTCTVAVETGGAGPAGTSRRQIRSTCCASCASLPKSSS